MKMPLNRIVPFLSALACAAVLGSAIAPAGAAVITRWDFNNYATGTIQNNPVPTVGTGLASIIGMTPNGDITNADGPPSDDSYNWWRVRGTPNNGWLAEAGELSQGARFMIDTTGSTGIQFQFDWYCTTTGIADLQPQYTTDGGSSWTSFGSVLTSTAGNTWKNQVLVDLSSVSAANNNSNFGVQLVSVHHTGAGIYMKPDGISPYVNGSGNWRFDMVTVLNDVSVSPGANVTWTNASGTGVWNTTDGNWSGGSPVANKYKDNDNAIFGSISSDATITVNAAGVAPGSTSVSNPANTYTFTGGSINGTGALIKSSTGTVVLNSANGYSGGTVVNGGTLIVNGGDDRLGAANGPLTLAGGTLQTSGTDLSSARRFTVGGNGGTFNSNGFSSSTTGHTDVNGVLTKTGTGNLTLNGSVAFDNNGTLVVDSGGSVTFGGVSDTITMRNGGTFNGNLVLNMDSSDPADPARLNFNGTVPYSGTGEIQVQKPNIVITNSSQNSAAAPIDVYVSLQLNSSNNEFTKSDVTLPNPLSVAHPFVTTIGGTRDATQEGTVPNNLHFHNPITGDSDFNVSNDPAGLGSGNLWLDAQNTYTGATLINGDHTATVFIAVDNALPTGTDVIFGTGSALVPGQSMPVIDLYGHSQQVNSLSCGRFGRAADFSITNTGNGDSVLKISGSTTPYRPFGGVIQDGTHKVSLEKDGSGTLSLSYTNTYTGTTAILGGTLALATAYDAFGYPVSTGDLSLATVISTSGTGVFQINDGVHFVGTVVGTGTTKILADASLSVADITQGTLDMAAGASIAIDGPNSSAIGTITGHGNVTVHNEATLSAGSITAESLSIGGVAAVAVPEPGTLIFVVSAALAGICQFLRRRR